jgi:hypothetical protein
MSVTSAPHPKEVTVYHGTFRGDVESIKREIKQSFCGAGDFHTKHQKVAFYTTPTEKCAELWAKGKEALTGLPGGGNAAVIEYKADLEVFNFGDEISGERYELWKKVKKHTMVALYININIQFVAECWAGQVTIPELQGCDVIMRYMSTGWDRPSVASGMYDYIIKHGGVC